MLQKKLEATFIFVNLKLFVQKNPEICPSRFFVFLSSGTGVWD